MIGDRNRRVLRNRGGMFWLLQSVFEMTGLPNAESSVYRNAFAVVFPCVTLAMIEVALFA